MFQNRRVNTLDLAELHVTGHAKTRHVDEHIVAIVGNLERLGDVDKIRVEGGEFSIVRYFEGIHSRNVEPTKIVDEGVGNLDGVGLCDAQCAKGETAELGEVHQLEVFDRLEGLQVERAQQLEAFEFQGSANRVDGAAGDAEKLGGIVDGEVLLELFGTLDA